MTFQIGARVRLRHDVERFPHFIAPAGSLGTVTINEDRLFGVKLDEHLPGSEEWDNEVHWFDDLLDDVSRDLEPEEPSPDLGMTWEEIITEWERLLAEARALLRKERS